MTITWNTTVIARVTSTQDLVKEAGEKGQDEGFAVQALEQVQGRGRHGNEWISSMGNLYLSFLLRPECDTRKAGQLGFVTALALSAALDPYLDSDKHTKTLKWPNDILIDNKKISGILLESSLGGKNNIDYIAGGIGVNIFAPPEEAIGLDAIKSKPVYVNVFRDEFLDQFARFYSLWQKKGFAPVREAWLKQAHSLGHEIRVRLPGQEFRAVFDGLDENGSLLAGTPEGQKVIPAGDVYFGDT